MNSTAQVISFAFFLFLVGMLFVWIRKRNVEIDEINCAIDEHNRIHSTCPRCQSLMERYVPMIKRISGALKVGARFLMMGGVGEYVGDAVGDAVGEVVGEFATNVAGEFLGGVAEAAVDVYTQEVFMESVTVVTREYIVQQQRNSSGDYRLRCTSCNYKCEDKTVPLHPKASVFGCGSLLYLFIIFPALSYGAGQLSAPFVEKFDASKMMASITHYVSPQSKDTNRVKGGPASRPAKRNTHDRTVAKLRISKKNYTIRIMGKIIAVRRSRHTLKKALARLKASVPAGKIIHFQFLCAFKIYPWEQRRLRSLISNAGFFYGSFASCGRKSSRQAVFVSLVLDSQPSGASVYVNHQIQKRSTPMRLRLRRHRNYRIRVVKNRKSRKFTWYARKDRRKKVWLRKFSTRWKKERCSPRRGRVSLSLSSRPVGADIYVDGSFKGTTPLVFCMKKSVPVLIRLEKKGYVLKLWRWKAKSKTRKRIHLKKS